MYDYKTKSLGSGINAMQEPCLNWSMSRVAGTMETTLFPHLKFTSLIGTRMHRCPLDCTVLVKKGGWAVDP